MPTTRVDEETLRETPWHTRPGDEVADELGVDPGTGLSGDEAEARLDRYGPNSIESKEEAPWWRILGRQFLDPLIYVLIVAGLLMLVFQDYADAIVIGAVVVLNATIGFIQEYRAQKAITALAEMSAPKAHLLRDGEEVDVETDRVVPGDVVLLASGTRVPADVRLLEADQLRVDEAALTGESEAVEKQADPVEDERAVPALHRDQVDAVGERGAGRRIILQPLGQRGGLRQLGVAGVAHQRKVTHHRRSLPIGPGQRGCAQHMQLALRQPVVRQPLGERPGEVAAGADRDRAGLQRRRHRQQPEVGPTAGHPVEGRIDGVTVPIAAQVGDQQAALFAQRQAAAAGEPGRTHGADDQGHPGLGDQLDGGGQDDAELLAHLPVPLAHEHRHGGEHQHHHAGQKIVGDADVLARVAQPLAHQVRARQHPPGDRVEQRQPGGFRPGKVEISRQAVLTQRCRGRQGDTPAGLPCCPLPWTGHCRRNSKEPSG